jgi:6-phosphogluconolactonase (cycloisomerase 2 family)
MDLRLARIFVVGESLALVACGGSSAVGPFSSPDGDAALDGVSWGGDAALDGISSGGDAALDATAADAAPSPDGGASGPDATLDAAPVDASIVDARLGEADSPAPLDGAIEPPDASELALVSTYLGGLYVFAVDAATGVPSAVDGSPYSAGAHFYSLALHPSRRFVYAVDFDANRIVGYRIDDAGALSPISGSPFTNDGGPITISADPLGRFVYVGNLDTKSISVLRVDTDSGALAPVPSSPFAVTTPVSFLAGEPTGRFVYVTEFGAAGIHVFTLDGDAGALSEIAGSPFFRLEIGGGAVAVHPTSKFVYAGRLSAFAVDGDAGTLTELPGSPIDAGLGADPNSIDLVLDPTGRHAYGIDNANNRVWAFAIDQSSGALTPAPGSPYPTGYAPYSVAVDPRGRFVYVPGDTSEFSVYSADPTTGALTPVAGSPFSLGALQPQVIMTTLPE